MKVPLFNQQKGTSPAVARAIPWGKAAQQPSSSSSRACLSSPMADVGVAMGAAQRLINDPVDDAERQQVGGRDLHPRPRPLPCPPVRQRIRCAAFRRDHRIDRHVQHQPRDWLRPVQPRRPSQPSPTRRRSMAPSVPGMLGRAGDGLGLAQFLRMTPGKGRSIDQGDDGSRSGRQASWRMAFR